MAPVVAVLRRGPTDWSQVSLWDLEAMSYVPGAWLRGTLYPQRCDVSPDGKYLCYFAFKPRTTWAAGSTYVAVSRLPWLHALAAWGTPGTWSRGLHFTSNSQERPEAPDVGSADGLAFGLRASVAASFLVERRRGWRESADTPPRTSDDMWDEQRGDAVEMFKTDPTGSGAILRVRGHIAAFRSGPDGSSKAMYTLEMARGLRTLDDVQWAEWSHDGRLLVATNDGRLQVRQGNDVTWELDVSGDKPSPRPAPDDAHQW
jgi:hypothetical protein